MELIRIAEQIQLDPLIDIEGGKKRFSPEGRPAYMDHGYWLYYEFDPDDGWRIYDFGYPEYVR